MMHFAKRTLAALMLLLTLTLSLALALPVSADAATDTPAHTTKDTALDLTATAVSEHLEKNTDERWYKITVSGAGDAVIVIQSRMSSGEYSENWRAQVFAADGETAIGKEFTIKGGTNTKSYALHPTEPTTYYLRIRGLEKANLFDAGDYTVSVVTALAGTEVDASRIHKGIRTVDKAGEVFLRLGDTYFIKLHDGEAKVALYKNRDGAIVPLLYGSREAVEFVVSTTGQVVREMNTGGVYGYGWSYSDSVETYTDEEISTDGLPLYFSDRSRYQGKELHSDVQKRIEISEHGAVGWFLLHYWYWLVLAVIVIVILVICFIVKGNGGEDPFRPLYLDMTGDEY